MNAQHLCCSKSALCLFLFSVFMMQNTHQKNHKTVTIMGGMPGDVSEESVTQKKRNKGWRMSCDVGEATEGLEKSCDVGKAAEGLENEL